MQKYKVAGYTRLSKEDKIKDESNSVTNQKLIINSYIEKNKDLELFGFYTDDGYSGTTFDRPEYKRMLKEATMNMLASTLFERKVFNKLEPVEESETIKELYEEANKNNKEDK